jgi:hypothetical protein
MSRNRKIWNFLNWTPQTRFQPRISLIGVNWPWITIKQVLGAEQDFGVRPTISERLNGESRRQSPSPMKKRRPRKGLASREEAQKFAHT